MLEDWLREMISRPGGHQILEFHYEVIKQPTGVKTVVKCNNLEPS